MEYTFTLTYRLSPSDSDQIELVERLGAAGCDDAVPGIGRPGFLALEFTREATSANAAITSALRDVKRTIPDATLVEAGPDLVGLTDVADMMEMSRQNLRKLMLSHAGFPPPVHAGSTNVWHLADVLHWLHGRGYEVSTALIDVARSTYQVNLARESLKLDGALNEHLRPLVT